MPTIEVDIEDLEKLVGTRLPRESEKLDDVLSFIKGEVKSLELDTLTIELKDGNRTDLLGVEGIARALKGVLGVQKGVIRYSINGDSGIKVNVDSKLSEIRPYIACAAAKDVILNDKIIKALMHLQDKLDLGSGRGRRKTSIGLYDLDLIEAPLNYTVSEPSKISFVPLGSNEKMVLKDILEKHPKGLEYGYIVKKHNLWPILLDSRNKVLSFPPIINSNDLGRITENTKNIFVEVTGTSHRVVLDVLRNVTLALAERGGKIYSTKIIYPSKEIGEEITPDLRNSEIEIETPHINRVLGLDLKREKVVENLKRARYGVKESKDDAIKVEVPCYRTDVMHPIDVVEDIAIMYGFNNIRPRWPALATSGGVSKKESSSNLARELMIGLGYQEILTFTMSNKERLFSKMRLKTTEIIEISNPKTLSYTCLRNWLIPGVMEFLSHNTSVSYPQKIFEVGYCTVIDKKSETKTRDVRKLACVTCHTNACFTEIKEVATAFGINFGEEISIKEGKHPSFIDGRFGKILIDGKEVGILGEIHPAVLEEWKLENQVATLEIDLDKFFKKAEQG